MAIKPWYKVVTPREDVCKGESLEYSVFAVHLHQVKDGRAPDDYKKPERFFDRTYLTVNLTGFAAEVLRRLTGNKVETNAIFNMATQFGGGKTHALTLLYHLAKTGKPASQWKGVPAILDKAGIKEVPKAQVAVFVGTEFNSSGGEGGADGTPLRRTPWGDIAYQLSGKEGLDAVKKDEEAFTAPSSSAIRKFLPKDKPVLILMDEIINYCSRYRKNGWGNDLYNFIQTLSEEARARDNVVLVVSVPASELEMTPEDWADHNRFKKLLDRLGKPVMMSAEQETSEIIRRRLFEWGGLPKDAHDTIAEYAEWVKANRGQLPSWFPLDRAQEAFAATYPFHPSVISVFERKWQALPRFQRTRGVLRLLALWVSRAHERGYKEGHKDALITLGTAPLDDSLFRAAVFEQLGEEKLEAAVTTDIAGKKTAFAVRLDEDAVESIRKARLHQKTAITIFFESNGGQTRDSATEPEIRLASGEPDIDIGNIETALEALVGSCYYLRPDKKQYRFGITPGLNQILADKQANVDPKRIEERVRQEIQKVFREGASLERVFFPKASADVENRPVLTLIVLGPDRPVREAQTDTFVEQITKEHGSAGRTYKSALIFVGCDNIQQMYEEAKRLLAWEDIKEDSGSLMKLEEGDQKQVNVQAEASRRNLREAVWRSYRTVLLLDKQSKIKDIDLGRSHSSEAESLTDRILKRLKDDGEIVESPSPTLLQRNWPPSIAEWSTKAVRDAFFASPLFPRLLTQDGLKETISRGVENGLIAYVMKAADGKYDPFVFRSRLASTDVEFSDEVFLITAKEAERRQEPPRLVRLQVFPDYRGLKPEEEYKFTVSGFDQHDQPFGIKEPVKWKADGGTITEDGTFTAGKTEGNFTITASVGPVNAGARVVVAKEPSKVSPDKKGVLDSYQALSWQGEVPALKWTTFFTKILSRFSAQEGLRLTVKVEATPPGGLSKQKVDETKVALEELGLPPDVDVR